MAVRNINVGGTNVVSGEACTEADLNDTFNAFYDLVKTSNWE